MITRQLHGDSKQITQDSTVSTLLNLLEMQNRRLAVEVNRRIIPRSNYHSYILKDADVVEIVQAIGGGQ